MACPQLANYYDATPVCKKIDKEIVYVVAPICKQVMYSDYNIPR